MPVALSALLLNGPSTDKLVFGSRVGTWPNEASGQTKQVVVSVYAQDLVSLRSGLNQPGPISVGYGLSQQFF